MTISADLNFYCGEDVSIPDVIYMPDSATPVNVSGWTAVFSVWTLTGDMVLAAPAAVTVAASGLLTVTLLYSTYVNILAPGTYRFGVQRTDTGTATVLTTGVLILRSFP